MTQILYLASAVAFIVGLRRLGAPSTARSGNRIAALGMLAAIVITLIAQNILNWWVVAAGLGVGADGQAATDGHDRVATGMDHGVAVDVGEGDGDCGHQGHAV